MQMGMIGLGRMGANMVRRLMRHGHQCVVYDLDNARVGQLVAEGAIGSVSLEDCVARLQAPRTLWIMVPAAHVDATIDQVAPLLGSDDILVDGGNSHYHHDLKRYDRLRAQGIHYVDIGTSGGVLGLERGYCMMIGGDEGAVKRLDPILGSLAPGKGDLPVTAARRSGGTAEQGYLHCGPAGAGHFVKMVHNGIEYGLMAAYAEGMNILKHAGAGLEQRATDAETTPLETPELYPYRFDLAEIAEVWRRGSVIASWLLDLTAEALAKDPGLTGFSGRVSDSGEGRWALKAALDTDASAPVLASALFERFGSRGEADYANRMLSAMRAEFGGHAEPSEEGQ